MSSGNYRRPLYQEQQRITTILLTPQHKIEKQLPILGARVELDRWMHLAGCILTESSQKQHDYVKIIQFLFHPSLQISSGLFGMMMMTMKKTPHTRMINLLYTLKISHMFYFNYFWKAPSAEGWKGWWWTEYRKRTEGMIQLAEWISKWTCWSENKMDKQSWLWGHVISSFLIHIWSQSVS